MIRNKSFDNKKPLLYLVAVPIGNLNDFSSRAIELLKECDLIACEDTRNGKDLLLKFNIKKPFFSLHEHNEVEASLQLIKKIKQGAKVAYMSDAGYPCISDPGFKLTKLAIENDIQICVVPGPSAGIMGLVGSAISSEHYFFFGFLSSKEAESKKEIEYLKTINETIILYESPHRIETTFKNLYQILGDRKFTLAREISKINEEYIYGTLSEMEKFDYSTIKGEMVIIIEKEQQKTYIDKEKILQRYSYFKNLNLKDKDIIDVLEFEYQIGKNYIKSLIYKK